MRSLFTTSLVVAGIFASTAHAFQAHEYRRRKTLGFGPEHPHRVFKSSPYQIQLNAGFTPGAYADPFETALRFVEDQTGSKDFYIRKDSYTDKNTGVTHVYARQLVNGLEVVDGDMNINVKNGIVLSFGNSFYKGSAPAFFEDVESEKIVDTHASLCDDIMDGLDVWSTSAEQVFMGERNVANTRELYHTWNSHCQYRNYLEDLGESFTSASDPADFRPALLQFMITATPKEALAEDIIANFGKHLDRLHVTDTSHFAPAGSQIQFTADNVPDAVSPVKARLAYIQVPNKAKTATHLKLVWKFEVEMQDNWYEAAVSANAPHRIISVVDWASDSPIPTPHSRASYEVFAWGVNDPESGKRSIEPENDDKIASPVGWHVLPCANDPSYSCPGGNVATAWRNTTTTWGNNVFAHENWDGRNNYTQNRRPVADAGDMKFYFEYSPKDAQDPMKEAKSYIDAAVTQLFYTTNLVHDIYYRYGFDEVSGNFQQHNFGRGGSENDAVIANAQDGSGFNNANFMTPPDGTNGRMRMYLWNTARPYRDGDLEAGIVIHELSHGLSTRLTGGPANSACLGWGESGGMGEGWGDFLATMIRSRPGETEYPMGAWAANKTTGIRNYIYSTDDKANPTMYKTLDKPGFWGVHAIGEVWAEMLWVVAHDLIEVHGYSDTLYPPLPLEDGTIPDGDFFRPSNGLKVPKSGNTLMMQLVISAMKLQPCRPSFFDARDAIIQADQILTGGENLCTLWKGFAKRGLGVDAKIEAQTPWGGGVRTNGYKYPSAC